MKIKLIKWMDISYSKILASADEAKKMVLPETILTAGFYVGKSDGNYVLAQTFSADTKAYINTSLIPVKLVVEIKDLKRTNSNPLDGDLAVVEWQTERDYREKGYSSNDLKKLNAANLSTVGFFVPGEKSISLYGEKTNDGVDYRLLQTLDISDVCKISKLL